VARAHRPEPASLERAGQRKAARHPVVRRRMTTAAPAPLGPVKAPAAMGQVRAAELNRRAVANDPRFD
jgi:hypothetical protein